jgi:hypothetical protein
VHFSLKLVEDAIDDVFDRAIIISADSDLVPAVRVVRRRTPGIFLATPPGRYAMARDLLGVCNSGMSKTAGRIANCLLPEELLDGNNNLLVRRPPGYAPPT